MTLGTERLKAPWTPGEVRQLNAFQDQAPHPYTCGNDRRDAAHIAFAAGNGGELGQLVATPEGWRCPACDYAKDWAHASIVWPEEEERTNP